MTLTEQEKKDKNDPTTQEQDRESYWSKERSRMTKEITFSYGNDKFGRYNLTKEELRSVKDQCSKKLLEFTLEEIGTEAKKFKDCDTLSEYFGWGK